MKADRVIGCDRCGKPCALVDDEIPSDELCPWCREADAPRVHAAFASDREALAETPVNMAARIP